MKGLPSQLHSPKGGKISQGERSADLSYWREARSGC